MKAGAIDCIVKSKETLDNLPQTVERTLRQWQHITERKRAEEELRKSEEFAKAILNATTDMVYMVDLANNILTVNDIAAKNLGDLFQHPTTKCFGKKLYLTFRHMFMYNFMLNFVITCTIAYLQLKSLNYF